MLASWVRPLAFESTALSAICNPWCAATASSDGAACPSASLAPASPPAALEVEACAEGQGPDRQPQHQHSRICNSPIPRCVLRIPAHAHHIAPCRQNSDSSNDVPQHHHHNNNKVLKVVPPGELRCRDLYSVTVTAHSQRLGRTRDLLRLRNWQQYTTLEETIIGSEPDGACSIGWAKRTASCAVLAMMPLLQAADVLTRHCAMRLMRPARSLQLL